MNIEFPGPLVETDDGGVSYRALVEGKTFPCRFTSEVLDDVDPAGRFGSAATKFEANQATLLSIAEAKIRSGQSANGGVLVTTADL